LCAGDRRPESKARRQTNRVWAPLWKHIAKQQLLLQVLILGGVILILLAQKWRMRHKDAKLVSSTTCVTMLSRTRRRREPNGHGGARSGALNPIANAFIELVDI
jgi:hypothetical protein